MFLPAFCIAIYFSPSPSTHLTYRLTRKCSYLFTHLQSHPYLPLTYAHPLLFLNIFSLSPSPTGCPGRDLPAFAGDSWPHEQQLCRPNGRRLPWPPGRRPVWTDGWKSTQTVGWEPARTAGWKPPRYAERQPPHPVAVCPRGAQRLT